MTEFMLFELFSTLSNGNVDRVKKIQDFAFVHFADRKSAEKALSASNGLVVEVGCCVMNKVRRKIIPRRWPLDVELKQLRIRITNLFLKNDHSRPLCLYFCLFNTVQLTVNKCST